MSSGWSRAECSGCFGGIEQWHILIPELHRKLLQGREEQRELCRCCRGTSPSRCPNEEGEGGQEQLPELMDWWRWEQWLRNGSACQDPTERDLLYFSCFNFSLLNVMERWFHLHGILGVYFVPCAEGTDSVGHREEITPGWAMPGLMLGWGKGSSRDQTSERARR